MDIIIFGGQSNMQGQTEGMPEENQPIENAWEYKFKTDEFVPLKHPVGEYIGGWLLPPLENGGSLVPSFCRAYTEKTGRQVIAVHAARGNTVLGEWLYGTHNFYTMKRKIGAALEKARKEFPVERVYYVWLQGESDAVISTPKDEYKERLKVYKNQLKKEFGIDLFGIIRVGYFVSEVSWLQDERTHEDRVLCDEAIMRAQDELPEEDGDFVVLTKSLAKMSLQKQYLNPNAEGHYNNAALYKIGKEAGEALANIE